MSKLLQRRKSGNVAVSEELQSKGPNKIVIKNRNKEYCVNSSCAVI